jgi:hypothetical protein
MTCAGSFVITWTGSYLVSCSEPVKCNVDGASACARAVALEMARSHVVANAKWTGRRTEARYAGNWVSGQAFFYFKRFGGRHYSSDDFTVANDAVVDLGHADAMM